MQYLYTPHCHTICFLSHILFVFLSHALNEQLFILLHFSQDSFFHFSPSFLLVLYFCHLACVLSYDPVMPIGILEPLGELAPLLTVLESLTHRRPGVFCFFSTLSSFSTTRRQVSIGRPILLHPSGFQCIGLVVILFSLCSICPIHLYPGVGLVARVAAWDPRILSSSPVGLLN